MGSDLISRSELLEKIRICRKAVGDCANHDYMIGYVSALSGVEGQICAEPDVDAAPVRHGYWSFFRSIAGDEYTFECSECNEWADRRHNYCPDCGAKMDRGEKHGAY